MDEFRFVPANKIQEAFIWCIERESVFDGGIGNGKTTGGLVKLLILANEFPGSRWVVFRQTYLDLCATTRRTFEDKLCPPKWITRNVRELTTLANGSEIQWMHLDELTEQSLRGLEINGAFGDQIEEINPELWEILDSRCGRWQMKDWKQPCPAYLWGTSNPKGKDWIYYRFHPKMQEWRTKNGDPTERAYFFAPTRANQEMLDKIAPGYYANLMRKPESWKRIWLEGNRDFFEGSIHPEFGEVHVYNPKEFDPFKARKIRSVFGWFDYGLSSPSCLLLTASDNEGYHYVFDEYYMANRKISEHAAEMRRRMERCPIRCNMVFADPSIFFESIRDRKVVTTSVAQEYAQAGVYMVKADNNEESSIENLHELFNVDKTRPNPITRETGSPKLFISKECINLIEQIGQQRLKEQRNQLTGEKEFTNERDPGVPDHAYDPLRYFANSKYLDYTPLRGDVRVPSYDSAPKSVPPTRHADIRIGR